MSKFTIIYGSQFWQLGKAVVEEFTKKWPERYYLSPAPEQPKYPDYNPINFELKTFADGEFIPEIKSSVRDHTVYIVMSTPPSDNLLELLMLADACKESSAKEVIAIVPYFGLCRGDRKGNKRTIVASALAARLMKAANIDKIVNLDLHAIQIQGNFSAVGIQSTHLEGHAIFAPIIAGMELEDLCFVSPDNGGVGRTKALRQYFPESSMAIINKERLEANVISKMELIGDVSGKNVIMVDDIADTAGTLAKAAELLKESGAKSVRAVITHPVMSGNAYENIMDSPLEELIVTDSIPLKQECPKITVVSLKDVIVNVISRMHKGESVSELNWIK